MKYLSLYSYGGKRYNLRVFATVVTSLNIVETFDNFSTKVTEN